MGNNKDRCDQHPDRYGGRHGSRRDENVAPTTDASARRDADRLLP